VLKNTSGINASGYRLRLRDISIGSVGFPTFSIAAGTPGVATVTNIPLPGPGETVYFKIVDNCGGVLPALPGGDLYIGAYAGGGICIAPPPIVEGIEFWQNGHNDSLSDAKVANNLGDPVHLHNGDPGSMTGMDSGGYGAEVETELGLNEYEILLQGKCGQSASMGWAANNSYSNLYGPGWFGNDLCNTVINSSMGQAGDPINTGIGNFVQDYIDARVAGLGGTTINLKRTYNS
ncbi:MAG: hypothetical protein GY869_26390, partial [Planctomycetes bacterium]|nr:hypothetical protein [Planctomycetota bacterium]